MTKILRYHSKMPQKHTKTTDALYLEMHQPLTATIGDLIKHGQAHGHARNNLIHYTAMSKTDDTFIDTSYIYALIQL